MINFSNSIYFYLLLSIVFNLSLFIPAYIFKTDKLTDISYSLTFIFLSTLAFLEKGSFGAWDIILYLMILMWALRLGGYLFIRIKKIKKDNRFDGIRESFLKFFGFWLIQGLSVWIIMIPALFYFISDLSIDNTTFIISGIIIWSIGVLIESVADYQKYKYIQKEKSLNHERRWIDIGLWKYSRHPNYLGEISLWIGIYIFALTRLDLTQSLIALVGPIYIFLIIRFFSGIPKLEEKADRRYSNNSEYISYKKRTGLLLPKI